MAPQPRRSPPVDGVPGPPARTSDPTAVTFLDAGALHPRLEALLRSVQTAERSAIGQHRRPTFRLLRELLGAAVHLGVPGQVLADCLGTSVGAVRSRANAAEGSMTAELVQRLTGLTAQELDQLSGGQLSDAAGSSTGPGSYRTVDVVRALLRTPRPST